jgi:hypothetical protein
MLPQQDQPETDESGVHSHTTVQREFRNSELLTTL